MAQRYKFSIESKSFPLYISGEPLNLASFYVDIILDKLQTKVKDLPYIDILQYYVLHST